jgi:predicted branched-subunit amino acid permease
MRHLPQRWLLPLGFALTDENFMVAIERYNRRDSSPVKHWYHLGTVVPMYFNWQFFTYIGLWAGRAIPSPAEWGLDFAFPATFIGMLIPLLTSRSIVACVLTAGVTSLVFYPLPNRLGLITASLCGVVAGVVVERWYSTPPHSVTERAAETSHQRANKP